MEKEPLEGLVDPAILGIVIDLNNSGLATNFSCSGHSEGDRGYVNFKEPLCKEDKDLIRDIFSRGGVNYIRFSSPSSVEFKSLEGPRFSNWVNEPTFRDGSLGVGPSVVSAFNLFGLPTSATKEEVNKRFKELAKEVHPDNFSNSDSSNWIPLTKANDSLKVFFERQEGAPYQLEPILGDFLEPNFNSPEVDSRSLKEDWS